MAETFPAADDDASETALRKEAEGLLRTALALVPPTPAAVNMLATAAMEASLPDFAEEIVREVLRASPGESASHHLLGCALRDQGRFEEAAATLLQAIARDGNVAAFHLSLADTLRRQGELERSFSHCRRALELEPENAHGHFTLGNTLYQIGQFDAALGAYRRALLIDPSHAGAHRNVGVSLFLRGEFAEAYEEYEWRWKLKGFRGSLERLRRPMWNGEPLAGRTLLIHAEQGLGDTVQFVRYLPQIAKDGGRILLQVQRPLARLLERISGVDAVVARGEPLPGFDVHCPLMSLPRVFATEMETIPKGVPYLDIAPAMQSDRTAPLRVGVAWAGNPRHTEDRLRSIPFRGFATLFNVPNVQFYRLHTRGPAEEPCVHPHLVDPTEGFTDLAETAAFMQTLDLVISVDTVIAHLGGALGKPTWTLLPFAPDWRWMLDRTDSPWYPTMRLFRQTAPGQWPALMDQINSQLKSHRR
jgi:Flp pilus assembly protein TadD